ncbi:TetR/AcrR family transcriptional regulator [Streptomyces prunicolor]|uniref:TetR/AcrR family transcriptional regulator n=1 Tax=Streptomyces prunicolor TaxID=67348 RepID=UPI0037D1F223
MTADGMSGNNATPSPGRQALLDAAISVVAKKGLRGLTYRSVAEEAGVTHALVTHYFGSRDAFILEALQSTIAEAERGLFAEDQTLDQFASPLSEFISRERELLVFQYELVLESLRRPELVEPIHKMYEDVQRSTGEQLSRLKVSDENGALVRLVVAALDGLFLRHLVDGDRESTEASVAVLRELLKRSDSALDR